jgi:hypothetical protein
MSAEYCLHIRTEEMTDDIMKVFFYHHLGSKWSPITEFMNTLTDEEYATMTARDYIHTEHPEFMARIKPYHDEEARIDALYHEKNGEVFDIMSGSPSFDVGEVSWLKASLYEGGEDEYIPDLVAVISSEVGEGTLIDDLMIANIEAKVAKCKKHQYYNTSEADKVIAWLNQYKGKEVFSISW